MICSRVGGSTACPIREPGGEQRIVAHDRSTRCAISCQRCAGLGAIGRRGRGTVRHRSGGAAARRSGGPGRRRDPDRGCAPAPDSTPEPVAGRPAGRPVAGAVRRTQRGARRTPVPGSRSWPGRRRASAGQARQELDAAKQENERLHAEFATLQQTSQTADARIAELTKAAEDAAAEAKRIEKELVTMRWQNAQLNTSLARAQAAREQAVAEAHKTEEALSAKVESLTKSAEQSATEIARLHTALADAQHQLESGHDLPRRGRGAGRGAADQARERGSREQPPGRAADQAAEPAAQAERERDEARARIAELRPRPTGCVRRWLRPRPRRSRRRVPSAIWSRRSAQLRAAASSAADAARQNLLAVEARIKELNAALVGGHPGRRGRTRDGLPGTLEAIPAAAPAARARPSGPPSAAPEAGPPAGGSPAATRQIAMRRRRPGRGDRGRADRRGRCRHRSDQIGGCRRDAGGEDLTQADRRSAAGAAPAGAGSAGRSRRQGRAPQGLALTVPGQGLFATNSDEIEPTAHDTLAKVAELIDAYKGHPVQIIGYTDSVGDATYNKILSQRRATLVKQFFVDNFEHRWPAPGDRGPGRGRADRLQRHASRAPSQPARRGPDPELRPAGALPAPGRRLGRRRHCWRRRRLSCNFLPFPVGSTGRSATLGH